MASIVVSGDTSGAVTLSAPSVAGTTTVTLPSSTGTMALLQTPSFATTIGVGGTTASASGAGISFPATQSASSDANTLDDYEEGSWTPTLTFAGGTTGITYSFSGGSYTKIGNQVTLTGRFALTNKGSSTGSARITGLPFTPSAFGFQAIQMGSMWWVSYTNTLSYPVNIRSDNGASYLEIRGYSSTSEVTIDQTYFGNSTQVSLTITYLI